MNHLGAGVIFGSSRSPLPSIVGNSHFGAHTMQLDSPSLKRIDGDVLQLPLEQLSREYRSAIGAIVQAHVADLSQLQSIIAQLRGPTGDSETDHPSSYYWADQQQPCGDKPADGQAFDFQDVWIEDSGSVCLSRPGPKVADTDRKILQVELTGQSVEERTMDFDTGEKASNNDKPNGVAQKIQSNSTPKHDLLTLRRGSIETSGTTTPRSQYTRPSVDTSGTFVRNSVEPICSHKSKRSSKGSSRRRGSMDEMVQRSSANCRTPRISDGELALDQFMVSPIFPDNEDSEGMRMEAEEPWSLKKLVAHPYFELATGLLIATNAIFIGVQTDYEMHYPDGEPSTINEIVGFTYTFAFFVDLVLRWSVAGCAGFLCSKQWFWNYLDMFVVFFSLLEIGMEYFIRGRQINMSVLRVIRFMRLARLARVLRVGRLLRLFRPFRVLIFSILHTLKTVVWAVFLLVIIIYTFGLILAQNVSEMLRKADDVPFEIEEFWGTLPRVMFTLFKSVTGGLSWHECVVPLASVNEASVLIFLFYICLSSLAVLNVITGVFCESAIEGAQADRELVVQKHMQKRRQYEDQLRALFKDIDTDASEQISLAEFATHLGDEETRAFFATLEIEIETAWEIFQLLDADETGTIDIEEFVHGCLRLRGQARAMDIAHLSELIRKTDIHVGKVLDYFQIASWPVEDFTLEIPSGHPETIAEDERECIASKDLKVNLGLETNI